MMTRRQINLMIAELIMILQSCSRKMNIFVLSNFNAWKSARRVWSQKILLKSQIDTFSLTRAVVGVTVTLHVVRSARLMVRLLL